MRVQTNYLILLLLLFSSYNTRRVFVEANATNARTCECQCRARRGLLLIQFASSARTHFVTKEEKFSASRAPAERASNAIKNRTFDIVWGRLEENFYLRNN